MVRSPSWQAASGSRACCPWRTGSRRDSAWKAELSADTQRLLRVAAACPVGDPARVWRAGRRLGVLAEAAAPAVEADLIEFGTWVRFRHPLVRSAAYHSASLTERQQVHRALAEATDRPPTRTGTNLARPAQAAPGPDEAVAAELARFAGRAQARGGLAAAAAYLHRAATLTPDPVRRAQRLLDAARAARDAGALDPRWICSTAADAGPPDELRLAEAQHLRGQIALEQRRGHEAARLLMGAARRLEPLNISLAQTTCRLSVPPSGRRSGARHPARHGRGNPRGAPRPVPPRAADVLLDALAIRLLDGHAAAKALARAQVAELAEAASRTHDQALVSALLQLLAERSRVRLRLSGLAEPRRACGPWPATATRPRSATGSRSTC